MNTARSRRASADAANRDARHRGTQRPSSTAAGTTTIVDQPYAPRLEAQRTPGCFTRDGRGALKPFEKVLRRMCRCIFRAACARRSSRRVENRSRPLDWSPPAGHPRALRPPGPPTDELQSPPLRTGTRTANRPPRPFQRSDRMPPPSAGAQPLQAPRVCRLRRCPHGTGYSPVAAHQGNQRDREPPGLRIARGLW